MGILDSLSGLFGGRSKGGGMQELVQALLDQFGGIEGLMSKLQESGVSDQLSTWVSSGANAPVSPDKITEALGADNVHGIAKELGVKDSEAATKLASALPRLIDRLTPGGSLPEGGLDMGRVQDILGDFFNR